MLYYICSVVHKTFVLLYLASCSVTRPEAQRTRFSRPCARTNVDISRRCDLSKGKTSSQIKLNRIFPLLKANLFHSVEETTKNWDKRTFLSSCFSSHVLVRVIMPYPRMSVIIISYFKCRNTHTRMPCLYFRPCTYVAFLYWVFGSNSRRIKLWDLKK